ncbi:antibiotic biosynthesis monooxygenase [Tsukamurella asaccharolytica]|uniref:Antibiotic biosynthesis monooxygenase n=1 Tax=Tsukamurella asaccharolytica TaxID=2592067 RepID=A0A5C5R8E0_9ACTN|nr:antibiotic biosynthesis monooxygenase [Tsukamurella asaccharolytica]TWS19457.1 antibiotic biosynthesis monooxygenase [Tsukamurella asaccharolytica]
MPHTETRSEAEEAHKASLTSVARRIAPGREHEFLAWTEAGIALARTYRGFLGGGWVRSADDPELYFVIYRFASDEELNDWQRSRVRKHWLERCEGLAVETATHRLSGIEGWFEPQADGAGPVASPVTAVPPRWKQAVAIWLGFLPLSLLINFLVLPHLTFLPAHGWGLVGRTVIATLINTPLMVFLVLPWVTARLKPWLERRSLT